MDFPAVSPSILPTHVHTYSFYGPQDLPVLVSGANPASVTWVANLALYVPITLPWAYPVKRFFWCNGSTITSNVDVGIYTLGGAKIYTTGSTARSGASAIQYVAASPDFILSPGTYMLAYSTAGTTNHGFGSATLPDVQNARAAGIMQQTTAFALPSSATYATAASTVYQLVGFTRTTSGF